MIFIKTLSKYQIEHFVLSPSSSLQVGGTQE